ncbi:VWA domain-containing protein [Sulfurimonas sp. MAG313]|nr:VWA domain-containing protein [Sulfurimonas sp. MAG313]MDF1881131.1 VWA domain-containing protein [Sulfurimonas sp. MAG313]
MSLLYPIFIYLMLPLTGILFYFIITGTKERFLAFDAEVLKRLRHENTSLSEKSRYSLYFISFIFMILALSQPVIKDGEIVVEAKSADILVGIDISDSMKAEDVYPNRLESAKTKAIDLIKMAPHNRIGVLAFAKHDYIVSPLSFDHSSVAFLLSKVNTQHITEKGTHLDSMLRSAIAMLEHADTKNLLLFTDGGDKKDFSQEIELAKDNGLRLFIIGIGTSKGSPVRAEDGSFIKHNGNILISKLNESIQDLATKTGGVYIESVLGDKDIKAMLKEIESITEKSTLKKETIPQYIQLFYYPLALAIFFLLLAFASVPKKLAKNFVLLSLVFFGAQDVKAGLLDFQKLNEAKEAYSNEDYKKSASVYENFAIDSPEAVYNLANSLYKDEDYERALKVYQNIFTKDKDFKAKALYNSANTQVKLKKYEESLKSYEEALSIKEDKQTRENYEAVKKFLEKKKEEKKQDQENKDKKDEKDENKEDKKNQDNKDSKDKKKSESDEKDTSKEEKDKQKSENKDKKDADSKKSKEKSEEKNKTSQKDNETQDQEQKEKSEQKSAKQKSENKEIKAVNSQDMSDIEAKKWINMIKKSQKGHLYKMQKVEHKEDTNEKPW